MQNFIKLHGILCFATKIVLQYVQTFTSCLVTISWHKWPTEWKPDYVQYSSQVTLWVHALRGMRAREKLARVQGCFEKLRAKPKSLKSSTIANLPERLLLRVLAQLWYSLYLKFTSQNIVAWSYNVQYLYLIMCIVNCYEHLVGGPFTVLFCSQGSWSSKYKQHCWVEYDSTGGVRQLIKCPACSCCAHGVSRENSFKNTNNNDNNNNRIFDLNILCVIWVHCNSLSLDPWGWARTIDCNLRLRLLFV